MRRCHATWKERIHKESQFYTPEENTTGFVLKNYNVWQCLFAYLQSIKTTRAHLKRVYSCNCRQSRIQSSPNPGTRLYRTGLFATIVGKVSCLQRFISLEEINISRLLRNSIFILTRNSGKSCSFCLPRVPFVNCRQFMYLVISLLVLRAGYGIWLYQFLIIAYLFTLLWM